MNKFFIVLNVAMLSLFLNACGTRTGNGVTGTNPNGNSQVTLKSSSYSTFRGFYQNSTFLNLSTSVSTFKFCVRKVKLENESGNDVQSEGSSEIEMRLGLIDVSSGSEKTWGTPNLPIGFTLSRIKVIVEKDEELCGINRSVIFNSNQTQDGVEFVWDFSPDISLAGGDVLSLSLSSVVNALNSAASAGQLNDQNLKDYIERTTGSGSK